MDIKFDTMEVLRYFTRNREKANMLAMRIIKGLHIRYQWLFSNVCSRYREKCNYRCNPLRYEGCKFKGIHTSALIVRFSIFILFDLRSFVRELGENGAKYYSKMMIIHIKKLIEVMRG